MLTDLQRDILVKAAEGIQEGMWCRNAAFREPDQDADEGETWAGSLFGTSSKWSLAMAASAERCATGELAYRTAQLGGKFGDYYTICGYVGDVIAEECSVRVHEREDDDGEDQITWHNDRCLPFAMDAFSAGQEWARIFRQVAES